MNLPTICNRNPSVRNPPSLRIQKRLSDFTETVIFSEGFIEDAMQFLQSIIFDELDMPAYGIRENFFGKPKDFWEEFVEKMRNSGKYVAHFYSGNDEGIQNITCTHCRIYVHVIGTSDTDYEP